jgi:CubicO group peptidase (beta-lactamase class C family)
MRRVRLLLTLIVPLALSGLTARTACGQAHTAPEVNPLEDPFMLGGTAERIDAMLKHSVPMGFSGSVFVYKDGLVILHEAYGQSDRERGIPNTVRTLFPVGTLEREFLFAAILRLEMDGRLRIDDTVQQAVEEVRKNPGSPEAAGRLAGIIEEASGQPLRPYLRQHLFIPAGMVHTTLSDVVEEGDSLVARGYMAPRGPFRLLEKSPWLLPLLGPSLRKASARLKLASPDSQEEIGVAGIRTTVGDLFRWKLALQLTGILSQDANMRLREWIRESPRGEDSTYRTGGVCRGYECSIATDGRKRFAVIVATNNSLGWTNPILDGIERSVFGGSDTLLTLAVLAVCCAALLLMLGVTQPGKRGSFGRRSRSIPLPW